MGARIHANVANELIRKHVRPARSEQPPPQVAERKCETVGSSPSSSRPDFPSSSVRLRVAQGPATMPEVHRSTHHRDVAPAHHTTGERWRSISRPLVRLDDWADTTWKRYSSSQGDIRHEDHRLSRDIRQRHDFKQQKCP
jgi:hypothetical protein